MRQADLQHHCGRSEEPRRKASSTHCAIGPNQVWCWDITWLPRPARGLFYYLYLIMGLYSRKIATWKIHENESSDLTARLIRKACLVEGNVTPSLLLHSDNGSPMKGASMPETPRRLGVTSSFSREDNTEHKHSGLKFTTPEQRYTGEATAILEYHKQVYRAAKARHPNRWSGKIRNWELPEKVWLNPEKEQTGLNQVA